MGIICFFLSIIGINIIGYFSGIDPFRDGKEQVLYYLSIIGTAHWIKSKFGTWFALAWICWAAQIVLYGIDDYALHTLFTVLGIFFAGFFTVKYVNRKAIFLIFRISLWIQLIYCVGQIARLHYFKIDIDQSFYGLPIGTLGHHTMLGVFMAALAPIAIEEWSTGEFCAICMVTMLTFSTMSFGALIGGVCVYLWRDRKRMSALASSAFVLITMGIFKLVAPNADWFSTTGRAYVWPIAVHYMKLRPQGYGPGSWFGLYAHWSIPGTLPWSYLHNEYLQFAFEGGVLALGFVLLGLIQTYRRSKPIEAGVLAALLVNAFGNFDLHVPVTAYLFSVMLCLIAKDHALSATNLKK